ncbi:MAG TPA: hypothetical protein VMX57_06835 [Planctomycetota bacterium]|nr:hypothetical protein [Planctomycetota bacterium]
MKGPDMQSHRWTRALLTLAFVLASSGITHAQGDARALEAEVKLLRATEKRLSEAKKELEKRVRELEAENARLKEIVAKNVAPDRQTPAAGATALVIPIHGQIGVEFTTVKMKRCLEEAVALSPTVVVLDIDTPGGSTQDAEDIVNLIIDYKGLRFVAFVRKAISAGSTITLACPEVYVTEEAVIGAATAWYRQGGGLPTALAEKQMSIWRAMGRKAAEHGGHSKLFAEAMVDPDFVLTLREEDGEVLIERDGDGEVLKAKGKILTLTGREAVKSGLAKGVVKDLDDLARKLGMSGWKVVTAEGTAAARVDTDHPRPGGTDFTVDVCHEVLMAKANELELLKPNLTALQREKANKDWQAWLESEKLKDRKVRWTLKMVNATSRERQIDPLEKALAAAKTKYASAREQYERVRRAPIGAGGFPSVAEKKRAFDQAKEVAKEAKDAVDKLDDAVAEAKEYPVAVVGNSPENARVLVAAFVHKSDKDALSALAAKSDFTLEGELVGLTLVQVAPGQAVPAVAVKNARLVDAEK